MVPISCSVCAIQNQLVIIEFLMDFCTYDDILDTIRITDKKLLHFKLSKSSQILRVDKTGYPRLGHICSYCMAPYFVVETFHNFCNYIIYYESLIYETFCSS